MKRVACAVEGLAARIAAASAQVGARVEVGLSVLDRSDTIRLARPGRMSANGSARMVRAMDGWLAVNLPRASDFELIAAWLDGADATWKAIERACTLRPASRIIDDARLLGLAVAHVGEIVGPLFPVELRARGCAAHARPEPIRVVDLSALWAGPLCAALLAEAGAAVTRIEHVHRPDPTPFPFADRLNGLKRGIKLNFYAADDHAELRARMIDADVIVTSARPRAFEQLGLAPADLLAVNPGLLWVALSAYGWSSPVGDRIGFGDDVAAAGGLVNWKDEQPSFLGDALADPLSGLTAAATALEAIGRQESGLIDVAMAHVAATVARLPC
jgi:CoA-transferase family III